MTSRVVMIAGFVAVFVLAGVLLVASRVAPRRLAAFTEVLDHLTASGNVRVLLLLAWAWLGWHFLAR